MVLPLGASPSPGGSTELSGITILAPRERERRGREDLGGGSGGSTSEATLMGRVLVRLGAGVFGAATADISSDDIAFADDAGTALADITPYAPEASDDALDALLDARLDGLRRVGSSGTTSVPDRDRFLDD